MKYLFHGDDQAKSRMELRARIDQEKKSGAEILYLDGTKIATPELGTALGTANLFSPESVVIENLCSRPVGNERKNLLKMVSDYTGPKNIFLWEKKEITKTVINSISGKAGALQVYVAKVPAVIFEFLDALRPDNRVGSINLMHQAVESVDEGFVFVMLARHVADLIVASSGDTSKLMPWKKSRLITQAGRYQPNDLLLLREGLLTIDRSIKTGLTKLSYLDHLDLLLSNLLN